MRQFVALLASMLGSRLLSLATSNIHAGLHIGMDIIAVLKQVLNHIIFHGPCEKVELAYGGGHTLKVNAGMATEGIKHLLAVSFEVGLVSKVHNHMLSSLGDVGYIVHLGIVRYKPVQNA